jgi:hypothetical protein
MGSFFGSTPQTQRPGSLLKHDSGGVTASNLKKGVDATQAASGIGALGVAQYGLTGLAIGMQTGSAISNAMYNANAMRLDAMEVEQRSQLQAYLIREQYLAEYKELQAVQEVQQSQNRVDMAKYNMRGASADIAMQSYAARAQKNLDQLYYNAAMETGKQSLSAIAQKSALLEKARQYDWQAGQAAVSGVINLAGGMMGTWSNLNKKGTDTDPLGHLKNGDPGEVNKAFANGDFFSASKTAVSNAEGFLKYTGQSNISLGHK